MRMQVLLCSTLLSAAAFAQPVVSPRAFEVASIRPVELGRVMNGYATAGPTVTFEVFNIPSLIIEAYGLERYQLILSEAIFRSVPDYYTIVAKVPGTEPPTRPETREMLQELLASRFHLKFHPETRETPVYALVPGRNGPKLRESKPDTPQSANHRVRGRNQTIEYRQMTIDDLTRALPIYVDRPVVNRTGLNGKYDIDLEATPYFRLTNNPQPEDITVFAAIQETLGLRLDEDKVAMPVVVVDAVEKPTEN